MKMWLWGGIASPTLLLFYYCFTTVFDKKKVGRKSLVEKVLPYQTFLREGIPTQWPNQFVSYSISRFYVLVRTQWVAKEWAG
jgi:hypothetical protein